MALITITRDIAKVGESTDSLQIKAGETINNLAKNWLGDDYQDEPWLCVVQREGQIYYPLRKEWDEVVKEDDTIHFLPHVGDPVSIILAIIVIVMILAVLFMPNSEVSDQESPDPVFSIDGSRNKARLNQPIEDCYGRNKVWASYISSPWSYFDNSDNQQYLHQGFNIGHGRFEVEAILLGDVDTDDNGDVEKVIGVNQSTIGNYNNVCTAQAVNNIEMLGKGEKGYNSFKPNPYGAPINVGAWIGPFAINPPNTEIQYIVIDITHPSGVYKVDRKSGDTESVGVSFLFEVREIDNDGQAIGNWSTLKAWSNYYATNNAIRRSIGANAPSVGRWQIRGKRTDDAFRETSGTDKTQWAGCKGYRANYNPTWNSNNWEEDYILFPNNYANKSYTVFATKTRASRNTQSNKITALCTRTPKILDNTASGNLTSYATRNPIHAMVNILRAPYGGNMSLDQLDIEGLIECAEQADEAGETFDYVFSETTTVWEACKICCRACRSIPIMKGSKVSAKRDIPITTPQALFNSENIISGSFKLQRRTWNNEDKDGLKATYYDHDTWRKETVIATLGDQEGLKPKTTNLAGVTNRDQALKLANYINASEYYNRQIISFKTTSSAISLSYGDIIKVSSDVADHGQSGYLTELNPQNNTFTLSNDADFGDNTGVYNITFRNKLGGVYGPFEVEKVANESNKVQLVGLVGSVDPTQIPISDNHEKPHYIFGEANKDGNLCKISKIGSEGQDAIKITCVIENFGRFEQDNVTAPPIYYPPLLPTILPPTINDLVQTEYDESLKKVVLEWTTEAFPSATSYNMYYSLNGIDWVLDQTGITNETDAFIVPQDILDSTELLILGISGINTEGEGDRATLGVRYTTPLFLTDNETTPNYLYAPASLTEGEVILKHN